MRYSWRLRGGLAWIASIRFPTSGEGTLKTISREGSEKVVDSELRITASNPRDTGFYFYQSQIEDAGSTTLMSYHGYSWGKSSRRERTLFDYVKRLARISRESTGEETENRVKPIPHRNMRDILTGIYFLRRNASTLQAPLISEIYSEGKLYPVVFRPGERIEFVVGAEKIVGREFTISAAAGEKRRWPGAVRVWLSEDDRRLPLRIEVQKSLAVVQLNLTSIKCDDVSFLKTPSKR